MVQFLTTLPAAVVEVKFKQFAFAVEVMLKPSKFTLSAVTLKSSESVTEDTSTPGRQLNRILLEIVLVDVMANGSTIKIFSILESAKAALSSVSLVTVNGSCIDTYPGDNAGGSKRYYDSRRQLLFLCRRSSFCHNLNYSRLGRR